jgi:hypothetical protein
MDVVKFYRKPNVPEYMKLERVKDGKLLVVYPISSPDRKRLARWINPSEVHVEWIKYFEGE